MEKPPGAERFIEWWTLVEPKVLSLGRRILLSNDAAQDLAQDVAMNALLRFEAFQSQEHLAGWAVTRARWLAIDRLRLQRRLWPSSGDEGVASQAAIDRTSPSAAEGYESLESLEDIFLAIKRLPERQRIAILRKIEGYDTGDIANELGVTEATVRSLLRHARIRLSGILQVS